MRRRFVYIRIAVIIATGLMLWWLLLNSGTPKPKSASEQISLANMPDAERHICRLFHEVNSDAILNESFMQETGDLKMIVEFNTNKTTHPQKYILNLSEWVRGQKIDNRCSDGFLRAHFSPVAR